MAKIPEFQQQQLRELATGAPSLDQSGNMLAQNFLSNAEQISGAAQGYQGVLGQVAGSLLGHAVNAYHEHQQNQEIYQRRLNAANALAQSHQQALTHAQNVADISAASVPAAFAANDFNKSIKDAYANNPDGAAEAYQKLYPAWKNQQIKDLQNPAVALGVGEFLDKKAEATSTEFGNWAATQRTANAKAAGDVAQSTIMNRLSNLRGGDPGAQGLTEALQGLNQLAPNIINSLPKDEAEKKMMQMHGQIAEGWLTQMTRENPGQVADSLSKGWFSTPNLYLTDKGPVTTVMPVEDMTDRQKAAFGQMGNYVQVPVLDPEHLKDVYKDVGVRLQGIQRDNETQAKINEIAPKQYINTLAIEYKSDNVSGSRKSEIMNEIDGIARHYAGGNTKEDLSITEHANAQLGYLKSQKTQEQVLAEQQKQTHAAERQATNQTWEDQQRARTKERQDLETMRGGKESLAIQKNAEESFAVARLSTKDASAKVVEISRAMKLNNEAHDGNHIDAKVWETRNAGLAASLEATQKKMPVAEPGVFGVNAIARKFMATVTNNVDSNNYYDAFAAGPGEKVLRDKGILGDGAATSSYRRKYSAAFIDAVEDYKKAKSGQLPDAKALEHAKQMAIQAIDAGRY